MNMKVDKAILKNAFEVVEEYIVEPIKPYEFTSKMMAEEYTELGRRQWHNKLDQAVRDGKLKSREIPGGGRAFWDPKDSPQKP